MPTDRRLVFALAFVAVQALLPLRYYLGSDRYDERFAWRMFSPIRMVQCSAEVELDGERLELGAVFHSAWLALIERGRLDVTAAAVRRICRLNPGRRVSLEYTCRESDGAERRLVTPDQDACAGVRR